MLGPFHIFLRNLNHPLSSTPILHELAATLQDASGRRHGELLPLRSFPQKIYSFHFPASALQEYLKANSLTFYEEREPK